MADAYVYSRERSGLFKAWEMHVAFLKVSCMGFLSVALELRKEKQQRHAGSPAAQQLIRLMAFSHKRCTLNVVVAVFLFFLRI
jgi:hypothetical protein